MTNLDPLSATPPPVDECRAKETWVKPIAVSAKVQDVTENNASGLLNDGITTCSS